MCHLKKAALLQGMMQQQQQQQAGQQNSTVVQQSTSSEKLRDQAHPSKQAWNDSKSLPHPQGSLQRPTSGPVQGIPTHHQRVQNSMNAQFGSMASPPQLSHAPSPQSNGQLPSQGQNPPQGQIPPQYLPQLQGCFVAMHKAAGQGGVGMSQARPLAPVSQDRGVGADPSALATITSGPASGGLHNPGVMYSSMQQGQAGSTSSAPILTSNFVAFHPVSQGGDSRMLHSGSRHQPSGVYLNLVPVLQLAMLTFRDWGVHSLYQHVSIPSILVFMQILGFIQFIGFTIISFVFDVFSVRRKGYKIGSICWEYCSQWKQWTNATSFSGGPYTGSKTKLAFWGWC
jgi:hypothetical protein